MRQNGSENKHKVHGRLGKPVGKLCALLCTVYTIHSQRQIIINSVVLFQYPVEFTCTADTMGLIHSIFSFQSPSSFWRRVLFLNGKIFNSIIHKIGESVHYKALSWLGCIRIIKNETQHPDRRQSDNPKIPSTKYISWSRTVTWMHNVVAISRRKKMSWNIAHFTTLPVYPFAYLPSFFRYTIAFPLFLQHLHDNNFHLNRTMLPLLG